MTHALEAPLAPLVRDFQELRAAGLPFVLATIIATDGSTYRKAGTQMLITDQSQLRGLLSGGCLEVDLVEHAREVLSTGKPRLASYDMRGEDDALFGIGSGCEGAMRVLLQRVGPADDWQPLAEVAMRVQQRSRSSIALVAAGAAAGLAWWDGGGSASGAEPPAVERARNASAADARSLLIECAVDGQPTHILVLPILPSPLLLLCGAGIDAVPLARHAIALGLAVTVCDHRPALVTAPRFPHCALRCQPADEFAQVQELAQCEAAIVMSHHLSADLSYLTAIADRPNIGYVGLLGPAPRRDRLLGALGGRAAALHGRLRAPIGLDIGARTPEAIALAAIAELHAWIAGSPGGPWNESLRTTGR